MECYGLSCTKKACSKREPKEVILVEQCCVVQQRAKVSSDNRGSPTSALSLQPEPEGERDAGSVQVCQI